MTESTLNPETAIFREVIPAGDWWVHEIKKGQTLRILDLEGNQAADTLFFSAADPTERYSADRTIQEQAALYLTTGTKLMSTEGNAHAHHHRRHLRPPRHARRRVFARVEHHALRPRQGMHARLPRQLHPRRAGMERRAHQARHHLQHQLLHERPGLARRRTHLRRRHFRAGKICRDAARRWMSSA